MGISCRVPWPLPRACESHPSLVGAKHRAHRGRVHFAHLRTIRRIEGVVLAPVSCEDVPVHFRKLSSSQRSTEPPSTWGERPSDAEPHPAADAIGISRSLIGIDVTNSFALRLPQIVQKHANVGQRFRLPRLNLRTSPVDSVDLGLRRGQRAKIPVLSAIRKLCVEVVPFDIRGDLIIPARSLFFAKCFSTTQAPRALIFATNSAGTFLDATSAYWTMGITSCLDSRSLTISSTRRRIAASTSRKVSLYLRNAARSCCFGVGIASGGFLNNQRHVVAPLRELARTEATPAREAAI